MQCCFYLKMHGGKAAIDALVSGLSSDSVLLNHEICYVMGQMRDAYAIPTLNAVLADGKRNAIVRHEAAEALGAIGLESSLPILEKYAKCNVAEVAETCALAIDSIKWHLAEARAKEGKHGDAKYLSVDPAPPAHGKVDAKVLKTTLVNEKLSLFKRYRAMFRLRDMGTEEAVGALAAAFKCKSAVVRHEIAFVMGQMLNPAAVPHLKKVLEDKSEHAMVRHEAAEALGSISSSEAVDFLESFRADGERIVEESCKVALDIADDGWGTKEVESSSDPPVAQVQAQAS